MAVVFLISVRSLAPLDEEIPPHSGECNAMVNEMHR